MALSISLHAERIDVVFDTYRAISIKNAERIKRSSGSIKFKSIKKDHPVKQWSNFLLVGENKTEMIDFLVNEWKDNKYFEGDAAGPFYATSKSHCYKLTNGSKLLVDELTTTQEEADTRLFLHAAHGLRLGREKFIIHSPDTDVFVMSLPYSHHLDGSFYFKTGTKDKCRTISIRKVNAERKYLKEDTDIKTLGDALAGLYASTG